MKTLKVTNMKQTYLAPEMEGIKLSPENGVLTIYSNGLVGPDVSGFDSDEEDW